MSYIVRNTIVLGAVLLLIFSVGAYFSFISFPKRIRNIEKQIKQVETNLQNTPDLANNYNTLTEQLARTQHQWETRNKEVPPRDITGETYGYLNQLIGLSGDLVMNMTYQPGVDSGEFGYNKYTLTGSAFFENLYKFVWHIENGRRLYKIAGISLAGHEVKDSTGTKLYVTFQIDLLAYYSTIPELNAAPVQLELVSPTTGANPFYPLILKEIPAIRKGEIDIERSVLKAVIPGKAFILDQSQKSRTLEEGDPVWLGNVLRIHPADGQIECMLNKGGVPQHVVLTMQVGQKIQ